MQEQVSVYLVMICCTLVLLGFLYAGLLVLFLLGIRICRFMRIHLGMKALYLVFVDVARHIVDFAVFATYIMVRLTVRLVRRG